MCRRVSEGGDSCIMGYACSRVHTHGGRKDPVYDKCPGDLGHIASSMSDSFTLPWSRSYVKIVNAQPPSFTGQAKDYIVSRNSFINFAWLWGFRFCSRQPDGNPHGCDAPGISLVYSVVEYDHTLNAWYCLTSCTTSRLATGDSGNAKFFQ